MKDFLIDFENKTLFANGDIRTGESDDQNKRLLLAEKASFKEFPDGTVGAVSFLESEGSLDLVREIRTKYLEDGLKVKKIVASDGNNKIAIDAKY